MKITVVASNYYHTTDYRWHHVLVDGVFHSNFLKLGKLCPVLKFYESSNVVEVRDAGTVYAVIKSGSLIVNGEMREEELSLDYHEM
jgi:hypothetical protein